MNLPYLTADLPGIGGVIKQRPEDFFVQEIPAYEPSGEGEHVLFEITKRGITTFEAVDRIARTLRVRRDDIGYAGMKDAAAVTRQVFSAAGVTPEQVMEAKPPGITIAWAARHGNKIRLGHLKGNRFAINIRNVIGTDVVKAAAILKVLERTGIPNYFGEQRFGRRNNNDALGAAILRDDMPELLRLILGDPRPGLDDANAIGARKAYERGELDQAMRLYPRNNGMERRMLARLIKSGDHVAAAKLIEPRLERLFISALQSRVFNEVVRARLGTLDTILPGEVAMKEDNGACFAVEDVAIEQPRADAWEISPTGPLVGYRMTSPAAAAAEIESAALTAAGLKAEDFRQAGRIRVKGMRRPLRVRPADLTCAGGTDEHGHYVTIAFTLPSGSFATVLMAEVMKSAESERQPAEPTTPEQVPADDS